jgi:predicted nucleic acid-binding protein
MQRFRDLHISDSVADAWIAATALLRRATLLHKNPAFEAMTELDHDWLA